MTRIHIQPRLNQFHARALVAATLLMAATLAFMNILYATLQPVDPAATRGVIFVTSIILLALTLATATLVDLRIGE